MKDKILSIQSKLVYGYVGNNIAELAIQLHGFDVIAFPTVYLSAHTGHQPSYGMRVDKKLFDDLITGIESLDILDSVVHIVSGYIGSEDILSSTYSFIKKIKSSFSDKFYICDPVMGDEEGIYIPKGLANIIVTKLLPLCDIMTPNHFEFEYIVGRRVRNQEEILEVISNHEILKGKTVIITSCHLEDTTEDKIETLIVQKGKCDRVTAPKVAIDTTGTGDLFAAVLTSQLAQGKDVSSAVRESVQVVRRALAYTVEVGNAEMNAKSILQSIIQG